VNLVNRSTTEVAPHESHPTRLVIMVGQEEADGAAPRFGKRRVSPLTAGANTRGLMV
jgi:hypothetical protein